eukprot:jgi/Chrzof1/4110/UNPLg00772.t1
MVARMDHDSISKLKRKPDGPPEPLAFSFSQPVAYGYTQFPYLVTSDLQHLQCITGVYDYTASCVDSNDFIKGKLCAVGLCFPPDTTISSAKQIVAASLQAAGATTTLQQDSICITRLPGSLALAGSCAILQCTDSSVPANILQQKLCPVLPVFGSSPSDRVKNANALVAPVTQVTRVQIPALTNFSGHTEFRAHSGLCSRQFPDLPG